MARPPDAPNWHEIAGSYELALHGDVLCNKCGNSCVLKSHTDHDGYPYGLVEALVSGGYASTHLQDFRYYSFSLCEGCLVELFDTFKIPTQYKDWPHDLRHKSYSERFKSMLTSLNLMIHHCEDMIQRPDWVSGRDFFEREIENISANTPLVDKMKQLKTIITNFKSVVEGKLEDAELNEVMHEALK